MTNNSDNSEIGAAANIDDQHPRDHSVMLMLLEAVKQQELSSDVVLEVLFEAINTGRNVEEVVSDHQIISRQQRESVHGIVAGEARDSAAHQSTVGNQHQLENRSNACTYDPSGVCDSGQQQFVLDRQAALPSGVDRYENAEEIGRGGWGVVVRAHDRQLDRDVAVKKLSPQTSDEEDIAKRFLTEARITGQLQHPGIVPVYERGISLDDRQPFYAMKLLAGTTLRDVIRDYHTLKKGAEKRQQFLLLLHRFVDVCQAIGYAHSQAIIHRDLKPSNVVIGKFGETVVVDWGLAKKIDEKNAVCAEETMRAGTPMPGKANKEASRFGGLLGTVVTQTGSVIGTPAFMSPEQARGATSQIDTRSDTYALGVMLYVILSGKPPFHGPDIQTTLNMVLKGEYKHPKLIDRSIPGALASICTKAMSMGQDERYQTASEIADDVLHFLANEPVSAHRDSWIERASRWCRRHPAIATTTIATAVILTVASSITTALVAKAHHAERMAKKAAVVAHKHESQARQEEEQAKRRALDRLEESRLAADEWLTGLSRNLQHFSGMQPIRNDLIEQAQQHYLGLFDSANGDPLLRLDAARCLIRLGDLQLMSNEVTDAQSVSAREAFEKAAALLQSDETDDAPELPFREKLNARIGLTLCDIDTGDFRAVHVNELMELIGNLKLLNELHHSQESKSDLARGYLVLGRGYESAADHGNAVAAYETSLEWTLLLNEQNSLSRQQLVTMVRGSLARAYTNSGLHSRAAHTLQNQIKFDSERLKANANRPDVLEARAITRMLWAKEQQSLGDDWAAANAYRVAVKDLSDSWQLMSSEHAYSENLAKAQGSLGRLASRLNRLEDAELMLRAAIEQLTGLMQSAHADHETASRLAACHGSLGHVLLLRGNPEAEDFIKQSIDRFEGLKRVSKVNADVDLQHGRAIADLGRCYGVSMAHATATRYLTGAVDYFDAIAADDRSPEIIQASANARFALADQLVALGDNEAAQLHRAAAIDALRQLAAEESPQQRQQYGSATVQLIRGLLDVDGNQDQIAEAVSRLESVQIPSRRAGPVHQLRAIAEYRSGDLSTAKSAIGNAQASRLFPNATDQAILGCIQARLGAIDEAAQSLNRAESGMEFAPGDSRLRAWVTELRQLSKADGGSFAE